MKDFGQWKTNKKPYAGSRRDRYVKTVNCRTYMSRVDLFSQACKSQGIPQEDVLVPVMDKFIKDYYGEDILAKLLEAEREVFPNKKRAGV